MIFSSCCEEIIDCSFMIDGKNFFYQSLKNNHKIHDNIRKVAIGHGEGYTTGLFTGLCLFQKLL